MDRQMYNIIRSSLQEQANIIYPAKQGPNPFQSLRWPENKFKKKKIKHIVKTGI